MAKTEDPHTEAATPSGLAEEAATPFDLAELERESLIKAFARTRLIAIVGLLTMVSGVLLAPRLPGAVAGCLILIGAMMAGIGFTQSLMNDRKLKANLREIWDIHADLQFRYKGMNRP